MRKDSTGRVVLRIALGIAASGVLAGGAWAQTQAAATGTGGNLVAGAAAPGGVAGSAVSGGMAMPAAAPLETKIFPLAEVKRGQRGVAYTVFEGVVPEPMEVEILGVLKDSIGPGQDMILARLHGTKPEYTGVVAGMSGSPVYIDGRLAGALSYRIGQFSKDPIAGITPIELMLAVRDGAETMGTPLNATPLRGETGKQQQERATTSTTTKAKAGPSTAQVAKCATCFAQDDTSFGAASNAVAQGDASLGGPNSTVAQRDNSFGGRRSGEIEPIETPLVFGGGFQRDTVELFGDRFRAMGLTPVAGLGGSDPTAVQPEPLVPGSAVSAVLVRGDLSMAGTCTVTYVDPKRLLACGHPITQFGPVSLPMTKAQVVATLASPMNAFKIINTTETVGSFTQDRASAIMGRFDVTARMIPVTVEVAPPDGRAAKTLHFEVVDNRELTPQAMLVSVYQSLQGTNIAAAQLSYKVSGAVEVQGHGQVRIEGLMAQNEFASGAINTALLVGDRFIKVYDNALDLPTVTGVRLKVQAIAERRTATIESARLSRMEARAGETVEVEATLRPYQAEAKVVRLQVKIPANVQPGSVRVVVSDGATVDRLLNSPVQGAQRAVGLADAIAQLNRGHVNDAVYVTLLDKTTQAVLESGALEEVPLSMANVLGPLKDTQRMQLNGESAVEAGSVAADYAVSGAQVLTLTVR